MTHLSISTSWNSRRHKSGRAMIDEIRSAGFDTVELNFALPETMVGEVLSEKEAGRIIVSSLHNMCPLPPEIGPDKASPDYYSLSSQDEAERSLAVMAARNTIECAKRFGAKAIVLHAGRVPVGDKTRELAAAIDDPGRSESLRKEMLGLRREQSAGALENTLRSLDELVPTARSAGVAIGIENRYYYREIPIIEELETIFNRFKAGEIYYWHDTGHAEVFERLGLSNHKELLKRFGSRLIGMHLHDIIGPVTDHRPPGTGTFDFRKVRPYISPDTILVMEVHEPANADEIRRGAGHLIKILG